MHTHTRFNHARTNTHGLLFLRAVSCFHAQCLIEFFSHESVWESDRSLVFYHAHTVWLSYRGLVLITHTLSYCLCLTHTLSCVLSCTHCRIVLGLFCERALLKRLYSAKETYNWIDPHAQCRIVSPLSCLYHAHSVILSLYHAHTVFFPHAQCVSW